MGGDVGGKWGGLVRGGVIWGKGMVVIDEGGEGGWF